MKTTTSALRMALLLLVAFVLIAKIESTPAYRQDIISENNLKQLSKDDLIRLLQSDAKWSSSSNSHDDSSEELKYKPVPYVPTNTGNSLINTGNQIPQVNY
ncbi:uncharacterized protein LOC134217397 [Armigeres subalbatus]|uniref:uncharacterized protein LOC134203642 n=1 Tax=Armigeres subalbatus TaxID=124917 RepID=UPI002ED052A2